MNVLFCVVCEMIAINIVELVLLHEERRSPFFLSTENYQLADQRTWLVKNRGEEASSSLHISVCCHAMNVATCC